MDADARREIRRQLLAEIEAVPVDIAGRAPLDLAELVAVMRLQAALLNDLCDACEFGTAVAGWLDHDLLESGGWRYDDPAETPGSLRPTRLTWSARMKSSCGCCAANTRKQPSRRPDPGFLASTAEPVAPRRSFSLARPPPVGGNSSYTVCF